MEQQCKIGGEGLRNRGVLNEDMITELPEALLLHILSSLPTKTVIATSVLSKRWRCLWKMMPNLKFDSDNHKTFSENVSRSLVLHKAPVLESLSLAVRYECDALEMGLWIGIAFARNVRKLVFKLDCEEDLEGPVKFPGVLCRCNNTLEILKLKGSILFNLPSQVCFNSLRVLDLYLVNFQDEESVSNLLCGCPSLQDLVVHRESYFDLENFTIAVPSLQRLTLKDEFYAEGVGGYVINAPSLKYLNIKGFNGFEFCLIENAPELLEAKIVDVSDITNENILESLTSAKRLSLYVSPSEIKYPTGNIFYQLVYMDLHTGKKKWWNLLSLMLDSSPKLQILKLIGPSRYRNKDRPIGRKWNQPKCVPECLLFHLETFVWTWYEWQQEVEKEVATYILKNARRLKKATLTTKSIECKELEKLEKRREMLDELANVVRASSSCHLVLESDTYSNE